MRQSHTRLVWLAALASAWLAAGRGEADELGQPPPSRSRAASQVARIPPVAEYHPVQIARSPDVHRPQAAAPAKPRPAERDGLRQPVQVATWKQRAEPLPPPVVADQVFDPGMVVAPQGPPVGQGNPTAPAADATAYLPADGLCCPAEPNADWLYGGRWYLVADVIALRRNQFGSVPFATLNDRSDVVLATRQQDFPFRYGMRLIGGRTFTPWFRVEGLYFGLTQWNEAAAVRDATPNALGGSGNLFSALSDFGNPPIAGIDYNNLISINYFSGLDNAEVNLRHRLITPPCMEVSLLYGVRYINIRERLNYFTSSDVPTPGGSTNAVATRTRNNVTGVQIGGTLNLPVDDGWWIGLDLKGAICQNAADQQTTYTNTDSNGLTQTFFGGKRQITSPLVGDLALSLNCRCSDNIAFRAGYQALWINNLALASQNLARNVDVLTLGPANLAHGGSIVYHGPHVGLMIAW